MFARKGLGGVGKLKDGAIRTRQPIELENWRQLRKKRRRIYGLTCWVMRGNRIEKSAERRRKHGKGTVGVDVKALEDDLRDDMPKTSLARHRLCAYSCDGFCAMREVSERSKVV